MPNVAQLVSGSTDVQTWCLAFNWYAVHVTAWKWTGTNKGQAGRTVSQVAGCTCGGCDRRQHGELGGGVAVDREETGTAGAQSTWRTRGGWRGGQGGPGGASTTSQQKEPSVKSGAPTLQGAGIVTSAEELGSLLYVGCSTSRVLGCPR